MCHARRGIDQKGQHRCAGRAHVLQHWPAHPLTPARPTPSCCHSRTATRPWCAQQIGYAMVFFWEYFGPMVVYPLFIFFPSVFYPSLK